MLLQQIIDKSNNAIIQISFKFKIFLLNFISIFAKTKLFMEIRKLKVHLEVTAGKEVKNKS